MNKCKEQAKLEFPNGEWTSHVEEYLTQGQHVKFNGACNFVHYHLLTSEELSMLGLLNGK